MNYGELRNRFKELLNRTDCTDELADYFISLGVRRTSRKLRTPLQLDIDTYTTGPDFDGTLPVPSDYIASYQIRADGVPLPRLVTSQAQTSSYGWFIEGPRIKFIGEYPEGTKLDIEYHAAFSLAADDNAITNWTIVLDDVVIYAALIFASIHFSDSRMRMFDQMFVTLVTEIQEQADQSEMGQGMTITPYGGGIA